MSARLGQPQEIVTASAAVGGSFTRTQTPPLGSFQACILNTVFAQWVASAGAGNRQLALQVKDASGNLLYTFPVSATIPASQTANITWCMGAPNTSVTVGTTTFFTSPLPGEFTIPPAATINVIDLASISNTDTCLINSMIVF